MTLKPTPEMPEQAHRSGDGVQFSVSSQARSSMLPSTILSYAAW